MTYDVKRFLRHAEREQRDFQGQDVPGILRPVTDPP